MPSLDGFARLVAEILWQIDAISVRTENPFKLASGNSSPLYVNCRRAISFPPLLDIFAAASRVLIQREKIACDAIAGGESAGIPFATVLSRALDRPLVYVRKRPKGYGTRSQVEGILPAGTSVLLVEDLITDGASKVEFIEGLRAAGGIVEDALVLFDREQGGKATLASHAVRLHAICTLSLSLSVGRDLGLTSAAMLTEVETYLSDPEKWHADRGIPFSVQGESS